MARPGSTPGGQAEPAGNSPITGVSRSSPSRINAPRPSVLTNQARTSDGAQRIIPRPPMPFENPRGSVNVPAPTKKPSIHGQPNEWRDALSPKSSASIHSGTSLSPKKWRQSAMTQRHQGNMVTYQRPCHQEQSAASRQAGEQEQQYIFAGQLADETGELTCEILQTIKRR